MSKKYLHPDTLSEVSADELARLDHDAQFDVMRHWFFQNFEDPAESTPYESREGGYIWIWGGPYEAEEELQDEFGDIVGEEVINRLIKELERWGFDWAPGPDHPSMENAFVDVLASSVPMETFRTRMASLRQLTQVDAPGDAGSAQAQLLLAASVSALEAYLAERAVRGVQRHERVLTRFIETHAVFKERKIPVAAVPKLSVGIVPYAMKMLAGVVWHRLDSARRIYEDAFEGLEWPSTSDLDGLLEIRHDIVHRAGVTMEGNPVSVTVEDLEEHFRHVEAFVETLEPQLPIDDDTDLDLVPRID